MALGARILCVRRPRKCDIFLIFLTFTTENPIEKWSVVGPTFRGDVAPKMCAHFMTFKYFSIRFFFAKCQKLYFSMGFPVVWQWFRDSYIRQGVSGTSVTLGTFTEPAPHMICFTGACHDIRYKSQN